MRIGGISERRELRKYFGGIVVVVKPVGRR